MSAFLTELKVDLQSRVPLVLWLVCAVSLASAGPFGSYEPFSFSQRLLIWVPLTAAAILCVSVVRAFVYGSIGLRDFPRGALLVAALACALICPPVYVVAHFVFSGSIGKEPSLAELIMLVGSITLGACSLRHSFQPAKATLLPEAEEQAPVPEPLPPMPRLVVRLEPEVQGELLSMSVRNHYVDVQTTRGTGSLLMRFSDAISEVAPVDGAQIHRSHWVAWAAVAAVEKEDGKLFLRLHAGPRIPVSRNHRDKLEQRGLL